MRRKLLLLALIAVMAVGLLVGCSDDESKSTSPTNFKGYVTGSLYLYPGATLDYLYIEGMGAVLPEIDSIKVGDSVLMGDDDDYFDYDYDEDYHDSYWEISFDEDGDNTTYMYSHGDMATIRIFGPGGSATTSLVILDADSAEANITSPADNADTISNGESETIYWNRVPLIDYYAILLEFREYHNGSVNWVNKFDATTDTMYTVTPSMYGDSLNYFYISVTPFNGPNPATNAPNVSGNWLTGKIYSMGWDDYITVYGFNGPGLSPGAGKAVVEPKPTTWTREQVIEQIYKRSR